MEYQFTHTMHGVVAKCSMDHEAFARWLNTEISPNPKELNNIFAEIEHCRHTKDINYEWILEGKEYSLYLNIEEVMVKANNLEMTFEEIEAVEDGFSFYDEESIAFCGLEDFEMFLTAYQKFIQTYH
ncbi:MULTISPECIES: YacL family protein [Glaesserella]|uniref:UPF0231 protein C5N92_01990 n=1 Tax=Glaesserella australis TaxID=2094024 RepID=A0A328C123_9PAST|nr:MULTISPECIES: YacL family protein [Glaesserella]AUI65764.1 hypothetical protein CJD39_03880 [Glaesserella sp. 15-184]RAL19541.1 hypothetical protein C5N92_01990 [Glaesserella australis]